MITGINDPFDALLVFVLFAFLLIPSLLLAFGIMAGQLYIINYVAESIQDFRTRKRKINN